MVSTAVPPPPVGGYVFNYQNRVRCPPHATIERIGLLIAGLFLLITKRQFLRVPKDTNEPAFPPAARDKWRRIWPWVAMNSLAGQTLGVSCLQWALETTPTGIVMSIVALTPLTVMPLARIFEGEKITARSLLGGAIAVAGVVMLTLSKWATS